MAVALVHAPRGQESRREPLDAGWGVLEGEHHLEERGAAQVALGRELLDQPLEGQVLVGVGAERALAHRGAAARGRRGRREVGAQDQGVDEEADEAPQLGAGAAGDGVPTHDVVLPGVAVQQRLEGGQQQP